MAFPATAGGGAGGAQAETAKSEIPISNKCFIWSSLWKHADDRSRSPEGARRYCGEPSSSCAEPTFGAEASRPGAWGVRRVTRQSDCAEQQPGCQTTKLLPSYIASSPVLGFRSRSSLYARPR